MKYFLPLASLPFIISALPDQNNNPHATWSVGDGLGGKGGSPPSGKPSPPSLPNPPDFPSFPGSFPGLGAPGGAPSPAPTTASPPGTSAPAPAAPAPETPAPAAGSAPAPAAPASSAAPPAPAKTPTPDDSIPAAQCPATGRGGSKGQWTPFILAHTGVPPSQICPLDRDRGVFWFMDAQSIGCCTQNAYLTTAASGQFACCQCGSSCRGLPPPMLEDWTLNNGQLQIGGVPYTLTPPAAIPTTGPNGGANVIGGAGPGGQGVYTTRDEFGSTIVLGFTPTSTALQCGATIPGINGPACETILYGPSTAATIIGPADGGQHVETTATSVLVGTFEATSCGAGGCVVLTSVVPTSTAFGVVTRDAAVPGARATDAVVLGGLVAGALGVFGAVL